MLHSVTVDCRTVQRQAGRRKDYKCLSGTSNFVIRVNTLFKPCEYIMYEFGQFRRALHKKAKILHKGPAEGAAQKIGPVSVHKGLQQSCGCPRQSSVQYKTSSQPRTTDLGSFTCSRKGLGCPGSKPSLTQS